jgi:predicted RNase H-like HicB family nuclease
MKARPVEEYLALPYTIEVVHDQSGEQDGWFARVVELSGCMTQADAFDELEEMVQDPMCAWIMAAIDAGILIPVPRQFESGARAEAMIDNPHYPTRVCGIIVGNNPQCAANFFRNRTYCA